MCFLVKVFGAYEPPERVGSSHGFIGFFLWFQVTLKNAQRAPLLIIFGTGRHWTSPLRLRIRELCSGGCCCACCVPGECCTCAPSEALRPRERYWRWRVCAGFSILRTASRASPYLEMSALRFYSQSPTNCKLGGSEWVRVWVACCGGIVGENTHVCLILPCKCLAPCHPVYFILGGKPRILNPVFALYHPVSSTSGLSSDSYRLSDLCLSFFCFLLAGLLVVSGERCSEWVSLGKFHQEKEMDLVSTSKGCGNTGKMMLCMNLPDG